jgi:alkylhydroperoxidase family enzyme
LSASTDVTSSKENGREYCVAAHSTLALSSRLPAEVVTALRAGRPLQDVALEAVRRLSRTMVARRGWVDEAEVEAFLAAGYTRRHVSSGSPADSSSPLAGSTRT